jgi:hypothetical protein
MVYIFTVINISVSIGGIMSRVIKFRAWDKVNKEMISWEGMYGICRTHDDCKDDYKDGGNVAVHLAIADHCYLMPNYCEVMQFTGILDRDGVEIYEGDILQDRSGLFVVKWVPLIAAGAHGWDGLLVIGNIYENPELVEVKS